MNHFKLLCLALFGLPILATAQFSDDFSDGNFTENPAWSGTEALFAVEGQKLRSNSAGEAEYYLSTPSQLMENAQWEFFINLAFATSGANYVDIYLASGSADLLNVENGYFLRFGNTQDEISLYRVEASVETKLIDGEDGLIGSSSNNPFKIQVKRHIGGFWELFIDAGATGVYLPAGSVVDNNIEESDFFGIYIKQSSAASPINKHFFDDIWVGEIPVDNEPPELLTVQPISENTLELQFSEPLDPAAAGSVLNYEVNNGIGHPSSVSYSESGTILDFTSTFSLGQVYTLTVSGVADVSGNEIVPTSADFVFIQPTPGNFKQVVFNEIMADPTPVVGLPDAEYLELFNASDQYFDLSGWVLVNTTTAKTLSSYLLPPGGYLLLCDQTAAEELLQYGPVMPISSFTALSNAADSLTLLNASGDVIDIVSYTTSWYQNSTKAEGGYSLELINPYTPCGGSANWIASSDATGGTPGNENSNFDTTPDTTPPHFASAYVPAPDKIKLIFDEAIASESLEGAVFSIEGFEIVSVINLASEMAVLITINPEMQTGVTYSLSVSGLTDCEGNAVVDFSVELLLGETPQAYELLITEIMADPSPSQGLPETEYFEVYNAGESVLDLTGCNVSSATFPENTILFPGEYLICTGENGAAAFLLFPNVVSMAGMSSTFLTNGGRDLILRNASGELVDAVFYDLSWYGSSGKQDGGFSLERINLNEPCRGGDNWAPSADADGGTPGAINSVNSELPDATPPRISSVMVFADNLVRVVFSEQIDTTLALLASFEFSPAITITDIANISPTYNALDLYLAQPLEQNVFYTLTISEIFDCSGNEMAEEVSEEFGLPQPALGGDILINEVLFDPPTGGSDFVELYNNSQKIISLKDWKLQNGSGSESTITTQPVSILPGQFLVLTIDAGFLTREYPLGRAETYFTIQSMPSFASSSGSVILMDSSKTVMDRFDYDEKFHFSLLHNTKGVSLERISYSRPTNDSGNWTSAAGNVGFATPGYQNSQYNGAIVSGEDFTLINEVFSPDNDGFEDVLSIGYKLKQPETVANITIYDMQGRIIRKLLENILLASEGMITWDGITDTQTKVPLGMYLIHIETFRMSGEVVHRKMVCVVASSQS